MYTQIEIKYKRMRFLRVCAAKRYEARKYESKRNTIHNCGSLQQGYSNSSNASTIVSPKYLNWYSHKYLLSLLIDGVSHLSTQPCPRSRLFLFVKLFAKSIDSETAGHQAAITENKWVD